MLGIIGAIVGGFLFSFFGAAPVTGLNIYSMVVAVIGAVVVLVDLPRRDGAQPNRPVGRFRERGPRNACSVPGWRDHGFNCFEKELHMVDENRIEGAAKNLGGKLQDTFGSMTGDSETQARGKANEAAGTAQNAFGSAMDTASEWSGSVGETVKDRPLTALLVAVSVGFVLRLLTHTRRS